VKGNLNMSHIKDLTTQEPLGTPVPQRTRTVLGTTTALALLGIALTFLFLFLLFWLTGTAVVLPALVISIVFALVAGFVATGVRWAPVLGSLVALAVMVFLLRVPLGASALQHPTADVARFSELVIMFAFAVIALVAGVAATAQNYRNAERRAPRWLGSLLVGMSGLAAGMIVIALLIAASPQSGATSTTTGGMPTVHMAGSAFLTNVVLVPKGGKLLLVDDDSVEHLIQNGSWTQGGTPQSQEEPGAPVVRNGDIKGGSVTVGPFTTAGVFHLYCTIHKGMNLTVLVQ
jgi:plastocyanin